MIVDRKFLILGIILIIIGIIIWTANIFKDFTYPICFIAVIIGILFLALSRSHVDNRNYVQIAILIVSITSLIFTVYVYTRVSEPPSPSLNIKYVGNINLYTTDEYQSKWDLTIPMNMRIFVINPSEIYIKNFEFSRNREIDQILVDGMSEHTNIAPKIPEPKRIQTSDSDVSLIFPITVTIWIKGGYGMEYGKLTKEKVGDVSFDIEITDLITKKSTTQRIEKEVFWIHDESKY